MPVADMSGAARNLIDASQMQMKVNEERKGALTSGLAAAGQDVGFEMVRPMLTDALKNEGYSDEEAKALVERTRNDPHAFASAVLDGRKVKLQKQQGDIVRQGIGGGGAPASPGAAPAPAPTGDGAAPVENSAPPDDASITPEMLASAPKAQPTTSLALPNVAPGAGPSSISIPTPGASGGVPTMGDAPPPPPAPKYPPAAAPQAFSPQGPSVGLPPLPEGGTPDTYRDILAARAEQARMDREAAMLPADIEAKRATAEWQRAHGPAMVAASENRKEATLGAADTRAEAMKYAADQRAAGQSGLAQMRQTMDEKKLDATIAHWAQTGEHTEIVDAYKMDHGEKVLAERSRHNTATEMETGKRDAANAENQRLSREQRQKRIDIMDNEYKLREAEFKAKLPAEELQKLEDNRVIIRAGLGTPLAGEAAKAAIEENKKILAAHGLKPIADAGDEGAPAAPEQNTHPSGAKSSEVKELEDAGFKWDPASKGWVK